MRYAQESVSKGVEVRLDLFEGMHHVRAAEFIPEKWSEVIL
jgi:hypothetical protein